MELSNVLKGETRNAWTCGIKLKISISSLFYSNYTRLKIFSFHTSENLSASVQMTKYEKIVDVKLHYLRSYGHFQIIISIGMYKKLTFKMLSTHWKMDIQPPHLTQTFFVN